MSRELSNPLRELAKDAINKVKSTSRPMTATSELSQQAISIFIDELSMFVTAGFIAEQVVRGPDARISDLIVFAKCFYLQNQPRRCLAALEQRGLLSAHNTQLLSETLLSLASIKLVRDSDGAGIISGSNFTDLVSAFQLAARCLFSLEEYEDCVTLLGPLVSLDSDKDSDDNLLVGCSTAVKRAKELFRQNDMDHGVTADRKQAPSSSSGTVSGFDMEINPMSGIYNTIGQCYDQLDNRSRAVTALIAALTVDSACTEAAEYLVAHGLLSMHERRVLLRDKLDFSKGRAWLEGYYRFTLLGEVPGSTPAAAPSTGPRSLLGSAPPTGGIQVLWEPSSAEWTARHAEQLYDKMQPAEAYRLARQAYTSDPFDSRGLLVYIACLLELKMKTELFYLGHELSSTYPKMAVSWYAVGCYYLCCSKPESAQKHLQRATKIDKRFAKAWVALGQSLSAQEESEHAIAAYRAACRLLPGDHRPMVLMAKELVRTNYLSLALHLLAGAIHLSPKDPVVLNEIGVIYVRLDRLDDALSHFAQAVAAVDSHATHTGGSGCGRITEEIFSNYATALRKSDRLEEALVWYHRCLGLSPSDPNTHASIAFTLHLLRRFDDAISSYHRALAMQPTFTFCIDMLNRAMADSCSSSFGVSSEYGGAGLLRGSQPNHLKGRHAGQLDEDACGLSDMLGEVDCLSFLRAL